jgi:hypothetical protein
MENRDYVSMAARFLFTDLDVDGLSVDPRDPVVPSAAGPHGVGKTRTCTK